MALIYVPLERLWPQYPKQDIRKEWTLDVVISCPPFPSANFIFLVLLPATQATKYLGVPALQQLIARMPWFLQFFLAVVVADLADISLFGFAQSAFSLALSMRSPFLEGP